MWATIETNVIGSQNIVDAALSYGVEQVSASSTDKSCLPQNAYGSSKHIMECLFQDANKWGSTKFNLARYGNVVASTGSVIPLFIKQRDSGGPLTVTMGEMTRFWIDLYDAVNLILTSLTQKPGVIVVPKALSMSMEDLAKFIIGDLNIEIKDIGIRPGEKVHEGMVSVTESYYTEQDDINFYINPPNSKVVNTSPFSYTSDIATRITFDKLALKIQNSKELGS